MRRIVIRSDLARRVEPHLGTLSALLLGVSMAFFCLAMPAALVAGGLSAIGLPPASTGMRLALALLAGAGAGAVTFAVFRLIDRPAKALPVRRPAIADRGAPQLRRADVHPDAPARRPIFAAEDLGTPLDLIDPLPLEELAADAAVDDLPPVPADPVREPLPFPVAARLVPVPSEVQRPTPVEAPPVAEPPQSLAAMMTRLEAGLARKALVMAGADTNVTPLKREIRPIDGPLSDAVETLNKRAATRR